ncbi:MAG: SpoIID/LytB domain-containing protein [Syntrophales bacterium]
MEEPRIKVGICDSYPEIRGRFNDRYRSEGVSLEGDFSAHPTEGAIALCDPFGREILRAPEIHLIAEKEATFTLKEVTIGVRFHWERLQEQTFPGALTLLAAGGGKVTAINELPIEAYLASVVASEMSGAAPFEFLKAHAVASRSWLVAMLRRREQENLPQQTGAAPAQKDGVAADQTRFAGKEHAKERTIRRDGELIRWYDREDHDLFDVCADDHCQRYQGMSGRTAGEAAEAVRATRGVFLIQDGEICDARYHKACGGLTEDYATCWEERAVPYLSHISDAAAPHAPVRTEADAERWILGNPDVYCNASDPDLLKKILPSFDQETTDFFRWQVGYGREELEGILLTKSGIDFGILRNITPLERGPSGRIRRLAVEGSKASIVVGKELEIRRWLSPSHLKSSAFIVSTERASSGIPSRFTLHGAGWGHGVGLCQIGAAVMADRGCGMEEILRHYFQDAALVKRY